MLDSSGFDFPAPLWLPGKNRITQEDICDFFFIIQNYITAGIPILKAIEYYEKNCEKEPMKKMMKMILADIDNNGITLLDALRKHTVFPPYVIELLKVGGKTGQLLEILNEIVMTMTQKIDIEREIRSGMRDFYSFIFGFGFAVCIALFFVLPKTKETLESVGTEVPWFTQIIWNFGQFCQDQWYLFVLAAIMAVISFFYINKTQPEKIERLKMKMPLIGKIYRIQIHYNFCKIMALCVKAGIKPVPSLQYVALAVDNRDSKESLMKAYKRNNAMGSDFVNAIREMDRREIFNKDIFLFLRIGAESGNLDEIMMKQAEKYRKLATFHSKNIKEKVGNLLITPLTILLLIFIVGVIFAPIQQLLQGAQNYVG